MLIFLARIPQNTNKSNIINFLNPAVKGGLFFKSGIIKSLKIMRYRDIDANLSPRHCLVRIEPDTVAQRVIGKLNRKIVNGKRINVREFKTRDWRRDPRNKNKAAAIHFQDRRVSERRQNELTELAVQSDQAFFIDDRRFHRML